MMPGSHPTPAEPTGRLAAGRYSQDLAELRLHPVGRENSAWSTNLIERRALQGKTPSSASISCWRTRNLSERSVISSFLVCGGFFDHWFLVIASNSQPS